MQEKPTASYRIVLCRYRNSDKVVRYGTQSGHGRYRRKDCGKVFETEYIYRACEPGVKDPIVDMALNGGGVRDISRVMGIGKNTVMSELKKSPETVDANPYAGRAKYPWKLAMSLIVLGKFRPTSNGVTSATRSVDVGYGMPSTP